MIEGVWAQLRGSLRHKNSCSSDSRGMGGWGPRNPRSTAPQAWGRLGASAKRPGFSIETIEEVFTVVFIREGNFLVRASLSKNKGTQGIAKGPSSLGGALQTMVHSTEGQRGRKAGNVDKSSRRWPGNKMANETQKRDHLHPEWNKKGSGRYRRKCRVTTSCCPR